MSRWTLPLDWSRFLGVALDHSLEEARVHRVTDHHAADMATALRHVKAAGWTRPGLVLDARNNDRTLEMRLGAFLARVSHDFPAAPPPLLLGAESERRQALREWLRGHKPDVVLAPDRSLAGALAGSSAGFVSLANYGAPDDPQGVRIDGEGVGRTAAFLLFSLLENLRTAAVLKPQTILIEGQWVEVGKVEAAAPMRSWPMMGSPAATMVSSRSGDRQPYGIP